MRRSMLFMPGNNPSMLNNADVFEADSVIFDLEDAVVLSEKDSARTLVKSFVSQLKANFEVVVRINGMDTTLYDDDLKAVVSDSIDAIMLPKARLNDIIELTRLLTIMEYNGNMTKEIAIIPIVELATSVIELDDIAKQPRVNGILLGAEDYTRDMEVVRSESGEEIFYVRNKLAIACRANKIDAIDTPYTNVRNNDGLIADIARAKGLGLNAKACIHPNQVEYVNKYFAPSVAEIAYALRVLEAKMEADKLKKGAFSLDNKMIDKPIIDRALNTINKARQYGLIEG